MSRSGWALACAVAAGLAALVVGRPAAALDDITVGIAGRAGVECGGYYEALAYGIYARRYDLAVTIRHVDPRGDQGQLLAAGATDFYASGDAQEQLAFTKGGVPVVTIAAFFQKDPLAVLAHPGAEVRGLGDLEAKRILLTDDARRTVWPWLKRRYGLREEQAERYDADPATFLADRSSALVADVTSAAFDVERAGGFEPTVLLPSDDSYYTYSGTLETSWRLVQDNPELVQRFVDATIEGWYSYLYGERAEADALIKATNPGLTDDQLAFALAAMKEHGIVDSGDALTMGIGTMEGGQWVNFMKNTIGWTRPTKPPFDRMYWLQFVNQGHGLALKETLTGGWEGADLPAE